VALELREDANEQLDAVDRAPELERERGGREDRARR
jgi:hypothetical protein